MADVYITQVSPSASFDGLMLVTVSVKFNGRPSFDPQDYASICSNVDIQTQTDLIDITTYKDEQPVYIAGVTIYSADFELRLREGDYTFLIELIRDGDAISEQGLIRALQNALHGQPLDIDELMEDDE